MPTSRPQALLPFLVLGALLLATVGAALWLCGGQLTYSLDDAYIHLAVAEEIARGGYGVNRGETTSPASSILWPFLLAPLARTPLADWAPLLLASAGAGLALAGALRMLDLAGEDAPLPPPVRAALGIVAGLALNLVPLVLTGMEQALQVGLVTIALAGTVEVLRGGAAPRWLWPVLVLAGLIRYESLAVVLPLLALLAWRGHGRAALAAGGVLAAGLGLFSLALVRAGLPALPLSVLAKRPSGPGGWSLRALAEAVLDRLELGQGRALACLAAALCLLALRPGAARADRMLAAAMTAAVLGYLALGGLQLDSWTLRYDVFLWAAAGLTLLYGVRDRLPAWTAGRALATGLVGLAVVALVQPRYLAGVAAAPLGSRNIHLQQRQMHRFVTGWWRAPVAVNDLGWVSYRNDRYVLDLWGLANPAAHRARLADRQALPRAAWLEPLCERQGARLVMVYPHWVPERPATWIPVARLRTARPRITVGGLEVAIFARDPAAAVRARALLRDFEPTLPPGAWLEW